MRILTERTKGKKVDVSDGIKVFDERGWAQVLAEPMTQSSTSMPRGKTPEDGAALEAEFLGLVEEIVAREDEAEEA